MLERADQVPLTKEVLIEQPAYWGQGNSSDGTAGLGRPNNLQKWPKVCERCDLGPLCNAQCSEVHQQCPHQRWELHSGRAMPIRPDTYRWSYARFTHHSTEICAGAGPWTHPAGVHRSTRRPVASALSKQGPLL